MSKDKMRQESILLNSQISLIIKTTNSLLMDIRTTVLSCPTEGLSFQKEWHGVSIQEESHSSIGNNLTEWWKSGKRKLPKANCSNLLRSWEGLITRAEPTMLTKETGLEVSLRKVTKRALRKTFSSLLKLNLSTFLITCSQFPQLKLNSKVMSRLMKSSEVVSGGLGKSPQSRYPDWRTIVRVLICTPFMVYLYGYIPPLISRTEFWIPVG